jgi:hypothetical protein
MGFLCMVFSQLTRRVSACGIEVPERDVGDFPSLLEGMKQSLEDPFRLTVGIGGLAGMGLPNRDFDRFSVY